MRERISIQKRKWVKQNRIIVTLACRYGVDVAEQGTKWEEEEERETVKINKWSASLPLHEQEEQSSSRSGLWCVSAGWLFLSSVTLWYLWMRNDYVGLVFPTFHATVIPKPIPNITDSQIQRPSLSQITAPFFIVLSLCRSLWILGMCEWVGVVEEVERSVGGWYGY